MESVRLVLLWCISWEYTARSQHIQVNGQRLRLGLSEPLAQAAGVPCMHSGPRRFDPCIFHTPDGRAAVRVRTTFCCQLGDSFINLTGITWATFSPAIGDHFQGLPQSCE